MSADDEAAVRRVSTWLRQHDPRPGGDCWCGWRSGGRYTHAEHLAALLVAQRPWEKP